MLNTLTIIVWVADVIESLTHFFGFLGGTMLVFAIFALIFGLTMPTSDWIGDTIDEKKRSKKLVSKWGAVMAVLGIITIGISNILPSQRAVYMMTGIQTVDALSKTEFVQEISGEGKQIVKDITYRIHELAGDGSKEVQKTTKEATNAVIDKATESIQDTSTGSVK